MFKKEFIALAAGAAVLSAPIQVSANDFAAGVVTGVIGSIIVNQGTKKPPRTRTVVVRPESPQRIANRETQKALNYFGFDVGGADGIFGPATERGVRAYQAYMGFPVVGKLTAAEREILVNAYRRGQAGDAGTLQLISSDPQGYRALLQAEKNAVFGVVSASNGTAGGNAPVVVSSSGSDGAAGGTPTVVSDNSDGGNTVPGLIPLIPVPTGNTDLASLCDQPAGPKITPVSMGDPEAALTQVFCSAVDEAKSTSSGLANSVPGVTAEQIEAQCKQLGPVVATYVGSLTGKGREAVLADVQGFVDNSGADPAQLASTARICLGTGYTIADMDVAIGSALLLTAMGEPAYGELIGHHLHAGVGVAANADKGLDWLTWSTDRVANGATPVFSDTMRTELVDEAVFRLNGGVPSSAAKSGGSKGKLPLATNN